MFSQIVCILHIHCSVSFLIRYPNFALIRLITTTITTGRTCYNGPLQFPCISWVCLALILHFWLSFLIVLVVLLRSTVPPLYSLYLPHSPSLCIQYFQRSKVILMFSFYFRVSVFFANSSTPFVLHVQRTRIASHRLEYPHQFHFSLLFQRKQYISYTSIFLS